MRIARRGPHRDVRRLDAHDILLRGARGGPAFLTATDVANPEDPRLLGVDLTDPTTTYPWSLIWRADETDQRILEAIATVRTLSNERDWRGEDGPPHGPV